MATFFRQHPQATGVLVDRELGSTHAVGLVSRRQFLQWRCDRQQWRAALDQPLPAVEAWWHTVLDYLIIDHQLPLKDVISLILDRPDFDLQEPIVIHLPDGIGLTSTTRLFAVYSRLVRLEQTTLAHADLESLRRQHQLILNAIGEGVYGVDLQGNATFVNPAAAHMIGWDGQELIGQSMHDILHHSRSDKTLYPKEACPIYAAFHDGIIHRVANEVFWRKDGTSFPVEYISTPMRDEQGELIGAVVAFRDITKRKWAEAVLHQANEDLEQKVRERTVELRQLNDQLKELSELRSRMVSMVCHEFRNPLNNILLSVSSVERYDSHLTSEQKESYLYGIKANVERMTQMIDDILMISKVEAKRIDIQPDTIDLVQFCRSLILEHQPNVNSVQIKFVSRNKSLMLKADETLLRSILANILSNSIRYSPNGGEVQFRLSRQKQQIVFQIKDRGIGIAPEDEPYLFEPFHRGRNVSNIPGTGLGLSIVKEFVDLLQGKIQVDSELGSGTTFTVTIPPHLK
ncbi:PAS domain-containing sensor histidine kinase [Oculatella sp. LEGE 06141]|nr:PAS domain-containing sensor histidine kinase [Oculatella sp. LEGE 06141]